MACTCVFIGTTEFSRHMFEEVLARGVSILAVYSLSREHAGRIPDWCDLGEIARGADVEHHQVAEVASPDNIQRIGELAPDVLLVMDMPLPLPKELTDIPRLGAVASHPSLLPKNRGRDALRWHILNGESGGGVSFCRLGEGTFDGPIVAQSRFEVTLTDTARTLHDKATAAGRRLIGELFSKLEDGALEGTAQDESQATTVPPLREEDRRIDWKQNARRIYDVVRANSDPYDGAFFYLGARKVVVWEAGFSHEPIDARAGEVTKISERGVEVAAGAGLVVLRIVQADASREPAHELFAREKKGPGTFCL